MMPVTLKQESVRAPFVLMRNDDEIEVNPTLDYRFNAEYSVDLPTFELVDENSITNYMRTIEEIVDSKGWRLTKEVNLGLLSFMKISMYHDLNNHRDMMLGNPVIRAIAGESSNVNSIPSELLDFDMDLISPYDSFQVVNADSSQQEAILMSKSGVSFVMQGPPGTGKSQTITNIIAEALADGRKVLFVSEKLAALEVVYRRLQEVQLDDFCLALHSHKANKKEILENIGKNLELPQIRLKGSYMAELQELFHDRAFLNEYANELHTEVAPFGESIYAVYGALSGLEDATHVPFRIDGITSITDRDFSTMSHQVGAYARAIEANGGSITGNPWHGSTVTEFDQYSKANLLSSTSGLGESLVALHSSISNMMEVYSISGAASWRSVDELSGLVADLQGVPLFPAKWLNADTRAMLRDEAEKSKSLYSPVVLLRNKVRANFKENIIAIDVNPWLQRIEIAADSIKRSGEQYRAIGIKDIIEGIRDIKSFASSSLALLKGIEANISAVNVLLRNDMSDSLSTALQLGRIIRVLTDSRPLRREWFEQTGYNRSVCMLNEANARMLGIREKTDALMQRWEREVFSIDANQMLGRFKIEYNGIFKSLKGNYRRDIKTLRAASKQPTKSISNDDAIALLQSVRDVNADRQWFSDNDTLLRSCFGEQYFGQETDWASISESFLAIKNLFDSYPYGLIPTEVVDILCDKRAYSDIYGQLMQASKSLPEASIGDALTRIRMLFGAAADVDQQSLGSALIPLFASLDTSASDIVACLDTAGEYATHELSALDTYNVIQDVSQLRADKQSLVEYDSRNASLFPLRFSGLDTDWDSVINDLATAEALFSQSRCSEDFISLVCDNRQRREEFATSVSIVSRQRSAFEGQAKSFMGLFDEKAGLGVISLEDLARRYRECISNITAVDKWIDYLETKEALNKLGLSGFVTGIEQLDGKATDITSSFRKGFYTQWLGEVLNSRPAIQQFRRRTQDDTVERFSNLDDKQLTYARARVREQVISSFPDPNRFMAANDEQRILLHELSKKRRIMPLRKLFKSIPNILLKLKPCLMMSPLSVAYFLEAESYKFDLVIFDEASQVFPQDAIGAIFRSSQVIIAGDSRQLPPTNFFAVSTSNSEGDYDTGEEYEDELYDSILEETTNLLPNRTLKWHYRSRYENLIAFSNQEIYKNDLITFPSSNESQRDTGVEYVFVENGIYAQQRNEMEARRCVELVDEHIKNHPNRSLGIIAFSAKQQQTITSAISYYREAHPENEAFFVEETDEEFFIKNLENVQGDERDTIIFSICYAKTQMQKDNNRPMPMRFGPLNNVGGERRLNVAITRAKKNIKLVGSIQPADIDLSRTESEGVRMLRSYIEYAQNGTMALRGQLAEGGTFDELVNSVATFIENAGYRVRRHMGCSKYKIDIAVEHPDSPDRFVAGIECDGYSYISARTARDRDHLRRSVLEGMGWKMHRVWSPEWARNPDVEREKLLEFIALAIAGSGEEREGALSDTDGLVGAESESAQIDARESEGLPTYAPASIDDMCEVIERRPATTTDSNVDNPYRFDYYVEAAWNECAQNLPGRTDADRVRAIIHHIVEVEQPIHRDVLYMRMAPVYGSSKATKKVRAYVDSAIRGVQGLKLDRDGFYSFDGFTGHRVRIARPGKPSRPINYIAPIEIELAMLAVAKHGLGLDKPGLIDETSRALGYSRKGTQIVFSLESTFNRLLTSGKIKLVDDKVNVLRGV
jgi:very-short-patch-repair endonuclease